MPQEFLINGATNGLQDDGDFYYICNSESVAANATETNRSIPVAKAMVLKAMVVKGSDPSDEDVPVFTVYKNGSPTALTVTFAEDDIQKTITGQSVSFAAGDTISMGYNEDAATGLGRVSWSILAESVTDNYFVVFGGSDGAINDSGNFYNNLQGGASAWNSDIEELDQPMPLAGTLTDMYVKTVVAAGSANWTFTVLKDAVATALTVVFNAGESGVKSITGQSVAISAGNMVAMLADPGSLFSNNLGTSDCWSVAITPTTAGQSCIMFGSTDDPSTASTEYNGFQGDGVSTWDTTESGNYQTLYATTIQAIYLDIETAPGAGNDWDFTFREEGASMDGGAVTVNLGEANTAANTTGLSATTTTGNNYDWMCVPTSSPTGVGKGVHISLQIFFTPTGGGGTTIPSPFTNTNLPFLEIMGQGN